MTSPVPVYQLALRDLHGSAGAQFGVYAGWAVPLRYGEVVSEHEALRERAALFERSYRSRVLLTGTDALEVLSATFAGHVEKLEEGRAMRSVSLDSLGNIEDLVLIARTGGIAYLVSGEPGQRNATMARLERAVGPDFDVRIDDRTDTTCLVGLAGPAAADTAREHLSEVLPARLEPLHCITFQFHGFRALAVRTSDVGEDGFEFMLAPAVAQHLIETLRASGTPLAGFQAVDIARVEAAIPAFEPDLLTGLTPAEADVDVLLDVPGGRDQRILAGLLFEDAGANTGEPIVLDGAAVGELRSCLRSPGLNATIGLGIIESRHVMPGRTVSAGGAAATIVAKPFYRRRASSNG